MEISSPKINKQVCVTKHANGQPTSFGKHWERTEESGNDARIVVYVAVKHTEQEQAMEVLRTL
ncbi:hypothetical protein O997_03045 [Anaplasma phagocytophilum str. MRK]|uniref:hypothetical protein n=1 Tax=Anaplasma phagocytophilum TaxID=948 RepID=UPI0005338FB1|nr:hypothetical protein [Anaplasma phagocytophilum]KDB56231.1 hypothetical protein O997_03045 [Anaplasma phagocytophilum str. MRK]